MFRDRNSAKARENDGLLSFVWEIYQGPNPDTAKVMGIEADCRAEREIWLERARVSKCESEKARAGQNALVHPEIDEKLVST